ncbi:MAG: HAMP domain-containing sensor histidine kinase [Flavobacteriaceae bacterium]
MFVFLVGYLVVALAVILGKSELLSFLSGVIFFMGALFVFIVVRTGLDSFMKIKELNQNLGDTELKNKELEQFAHVTSHDLKTPLRGISSLASFIKEDFETGKKEDVFRHINDMQGRVERLDNLINGILKYSKLGKITVAKVDLGKMIKEVFKTYQQFGNVKLTINGKLPIVDGDKVQLSQVISNLIGNAVNHNNRSICEVCVSSIETPESYKIIVEDNGPGIEPRYHEKIFEVFQTIGGEGTNDSTGIGLSIVRKIIEKHNGTIRVESDGKLGSKFIVNYPKMVK